MLSFHLLKDENVHRVSCFSFYTLSSLCKTKTLTISEQWPGVNIVHPSVPENQGRYQKKNPTHSSGNSLVNIIIFTIRADHMHVKGCVIKNIYNGDLKKVQEVLMNFLLF